MTRVATPDPFVRSLTEYGYRPTGPGMVRWDPDYDSMVGVIQLTLMEHGPPAASTSEQDAAGSRAGHSTSDEGSALPHSLPEGHA